LAFALPGIVIALALVFFGANYAQALYQTLALLVLAYVIRFLPEAVGSVRTGLLQVSPRLEEAARSLGSGPLRVLVRVTAPLVWPGAMAGAALVFMSTMKELPVTLLLAPIGFRTLATTSWSYATEGFFAQAALPALLLVAASAASLPLLLRQEKRQETEQTHE
jgi:iron(III) transport system permease protein